MFRKFVCILTIVTLLAGVHRQAQAFVGPPPVPVLGIITAGGPVAWSIAAISALVAAGTAIYGFSVKNDAAGDALKLTINPKAPRTVPSGWSAGSPASSEPVPPSTATGIPVYSATIGGGTCTNAASVDACFNAIVPSFSTSPCGGAAPLYAYSYSAPTMSITRSYPGTSLPGSCLTGGFASGSVTVGTSCATGYTLTAGVCTLSNASVVVKPSDNMAEKRISAGTIVDAPNDPDNAGSLPAGVTSTDSQITVKQGTSTVTVKVNPDGTITASTTTGNGNGTSTRTSITTAAPDSGATDGGTKAIAAKSEQVLGEGGTSDTDTAASVVTCTNCATESTQQAVKSAVETIKNDGVKLQEQTGTWSSEKAASDSARADALKAAQDHQKRFTDASGGDASKFGIPGLAWVAPAAEWTWGTLFPSPASCEPIAVSFKGGMNLDICPFVNTAKPWLEWFLYLMTVLYIYGTFWRRNRGG